ncbi:MAG TPA: hypothetical protein VFA23_10785 [Dongiaceae bacterium]|nr:hypothetical protein [Dongiaceae bacterium]
MKPALAPLLILVLLGASGCAAAVIAAVGTGAGFGYSEVKGADTARQPAGRAAAAPPAHGPRPAKPVGLQPPPGEFVECRLKDEVVAMSAADCGARGGIAP